MFRFRFDAALLVVAFLALGVDALAAENDVYSAAVAHPGRSAADLKRDATDRPEDVLRLSGIKPGSNVVDVLASDGYYSELLSYLVGPKGHVLLLNNEAFDKFSNNGWKERVEKQHLGNVEHVTVALDKMNLGEGTLDAAMFVKVYHDLYWVSPQDGWPKIDVGSVLDQTVRALKPGGIVVVVDHSAKPGTGSSAAGDLHRIDEVFARKDFESHGLVFVTQSEVLRRPDDARDQVSYKPPMLGKTDRFVYVFRKPGG
ncbi:MAG: class I SAM-dependent methyltransferase [Rhodanobacteraceae bacterium]